ncbi:MFS transporter [Lentzea sp. NPDC060358]|uniref:MFS transporter n=1 Tax=Lentzea sp. NPDC060358 TaxID=3347103 RepID=UPI0036611963
MLFTPPFRGFFLGRTVSLLGSSMAPVALAFAVLDASGRLTDLGVVLAAQMVPQLALLLVGGAVADRMSRRVVLVVTNLGAGVVQGLVAAVLLTGQYRPAVVAGLAFVLGAIEAFASPALRGIVPELVREDDLQKATAVLASARNAVKIAGPAAAGLLVAGAGPGWAIAADALSFLVAAAFLARLPPRTVVPAARRRLLADVRAGWVEFRRIPWVWPMALSYCAINLVNTGPWLVLGPSLTKERDGEAAWGLVLGVRAVGLLVMSVVVVRLVVRHPLRVGTVAGAAGAAGLLALGLGFGTTWSAVCAFVAGLGFAVSGILWETSLQRHVPREALSRVASHDDLLSYAAIPLSQLLVGPAAAVWGGATVALWAGVLFVVAALAPLAVKPVRNLGVHAAGGSRESNSLNGANDCR